MESLTDIITDAQAVRLAAFFDEQRKAQARRLAEQFDSVSRNYARAETTRNRVGWNTSADDLSKRASEAAITTGQARAYTAVVADLRGVVATRIHAARLAFLEAFPVSFSEKPLELTETRQRRVVRRADGSIAGRGYYAAPRPGTGDREELEDYTVPVKDARAVRLGDTVIGYIGKPEEARHRATTKYSLRHFGQETFGASYGGEVGRQNASDAVVANFIERFLEAFGCDPRQLKDAWQGVSIQDQVEAEAGLIEAGD